jgi:hypothetical protein
MLNPISDQTISALIGVIIGYLLKLLYNLALQNNALKHEKYKIILLVDNLELLIKNIHKTIY